MNNKSKFDFFERVKILPKDQYHYPHIKKKSFANTEGTITSKVLCNNDTEWRYGVSVDQDDGIIWVYREDEIESLGTFVTKEDFYTEESIRGGVTKEGERYIFDDDDRIDEESLREYMNNKSKFDFRERVKILPKYPYTYPSMKKNIKNKSFANTEGTVSSKVIGYQNKWVYGISVDKDDGRVWGFEEDELESLGKFIKKEDYYTGESIKVGVTKDGEGYIIDDEQNMK